MEKSGVKQKKSKWTTLIMIDSQAVKNTCSASVASNGFYFYKATNGIKRHLAVDSLGFPFFTHCTRANITDDQGLIQMLTHTMDYFWQKPLELAKTTILLDHGYHLEKIQKVLEQVYPEIMRKIQFEVAAKLSKSEKAAQGKSRFVLVAVLSPTDLGQPLLEYSIQTIAERLAPTLLKQYEKLIP